MATIIRRTFATFRAMSMTMNSAGLPEIFQPPINRSMQELDRSFFRKVVPISAATIFDPKEITRIRTALMRSNDLLKITGVPPIVNDDTDPGKRCIMLKPEIKADQPETWSDRLSQMVEENLVRIRPFDLVLKYENWTMSNILEAVLPELPEDQKETPTGFAQVGHIAHLNLRSQYQPYKHLIGQVLLDKNPTLRTVINKTLDVGSESVYRTFPYEILAGDKDLDVTISQTDCEFKFNFAEVYWNTRLNTEHERVIAKFQPGEAVCDVMAGVGPFAIPAGKKQVFVRANDLNPHCYEGLIWAAKRNKVNGFVEASCMDGRQFIRNSTANLATSPRTYEKVPNIKIPRNASPSKMEEVALRRLRQTVKYHEPKVFDHYVMNLPATAVEFLDAFHGLYSDREAEFAPVVPNRKLPMVHVYTFQDRHETDEQEVKEVCEKVSRYLGAEIKPDGEDVEIFSARLVSPTKRYYRASFRLPAEVAFASQEKYVQAETYNFVPIRHKEVNVDKPRGRELSRDLTVN